MSKRPSFLADASKAIRPGFATAIVFSFFVNLLAFVGPLYMLQVYDRVLGSRNIGTLVALTIIAGFLLIVYAALEKIRSSILVRLGLLFAAVDRSRPGQRQFSISPIALGPDRSIDFSGFSRFSNR